MKYNKEQVDSLQNAKTIEDYLFAVNPFTKNHMVIISSNVTPCGSSKFTYQLGSLFCETFSTKINLFDKTNLSYAAVIDSGSLTYENCTTELIDYSFSVREKMFRVVSGNAELALTKSEWDDLENVIGINIDKSNFSYPRRMKQERKISILLYNKDNEIFCVAFLDGYTCKLLQTFINPLYIDSYDKHESLNVFFPSRIRSNKISLYDSALSKMPKQFSENSIEPAVNNAAPFKRRIYALMTGSIRNQYDMYSILYLIFDYIERGIIEGLVWSTWSGEPEMVPGLREKLNLFGVMIVETQLPGPINGDTAQKLQIRNGLCVIPNDAWVIRVRADFALDYFVPIIDVLCNVDDLDIAEIDAIPQFLRKKIICALYISEHPNEGKGTSILDWAFYFPDFCFAATKNDMLMMTNIFETSYILGAEIMPEVAFFGGAFLLNFPFLIEYFHFLFQYTPRLFISKETPVCDLTRAMYLNIDDADNFMLPTFLEKLLSVLFPLYYGHFYFADVMKNPENIEGDIDFIDIFTEVDSGNKRVPRHTVSHWHLKKLISRQVRPCAGYTRFLQTYNRVVSDWTYAKNLHLTSDDMNEVMQILSERGYSPVIANPWLAKVGSYLKFDNKLLAKKSEYLFDYLDNNEREQLVSIYNKHLNYPDCKERIMQECETNSELLPRVFRVLIKGLTARYDFLLPLSKYPNTYLNFVKQVIMNGGAEADMGTLSTVRFDVDFLKIIEENLLSPVLFAANFLLLRFLEKSDENSPVYVPTHKYKIIGPKFADLVRGVTGVTENECENCESSSETVLNIIEHKLASDKNWEHSNIFREFLKIIEE